MHNSPRCVFGGASSGVGGAQPRSGEGCVSTRQHARQSHREQAQSPPLARSLWAEMPRNTEQCHTQMQRSLKTWVRLQVVTNLL